MGEQTGFRGDVQGLRAIAVAAVVLYHAGLPALAGGYIGVDVFFVISGFLITAHLLRERERDGRIALGRFAARRIRRILPASLAVVVLSVLAALVWFPPLLMREVWEGALASAFGVANYLFAVDGSDYLAESTPSLFQHYWSLGVEEQFYLVWPVLLAGIAVLVRERRRTMFAVIALIAGVSFAACVMLTFDAQPWAFFSLHSRAWELAVGALVAVLLAARPRPVTGTTAAVLGWAGVAGIVGAAVLFDDTTPFPGAWAALPVVATALVIVAGASAPHLGPTRVLSIPVMLFVGLISYSLYLVHWPILLIPQAAVGFQEPLPLGVSLALAAASVPVAWVLMRVVEDPLRRARWLTRARPRRSIIAAVTASALVALTATGAYAVAESRPLHAGRTVASTAMTQPPQLTSFVPANLRPSLEEVAEDQPVIYADGCNLGYAASAPVDCVYGDREAPRIVLFGDSHAAQWFPAVAEVAAATGHAVESHTKSSCPSVDVAVRRGGVLYDECDVWRHAVLDRLAENPPALVVLANYGRAELAADGDAAQRWEIGLRATLDGIDAPVVILADTPDLRTSPTVCLSSHLDAARTCGREPEVALDAPAREVERRVAAERGIAYVDLTPHLCTVDLCGAVIGSTLAYRDSHHLTATGSALLGAPLIVELQPILRGETPRSE